MPQNQYFNGYIMREHNAKCDVAHSQEIGRTEGTLKLHARHFIDHMVACDDQLGLGKDTQFRAHMREHQAKCQTPAAKRSWGAAKSHKTLPLPVIRQKPLGDPPLGSVQSPISQIASLVQQLQDTAVSNDSSCSSDDDKWD
jgi:hypothetical protein|eukprot:COSAG02_NODE_9938_length_2070_cov_1.861492_2_plen_141_part_00